MTERHLAPDHNSLQAFLAPQESLDSSNVFVDPKHGYSVYPITGATGREGDSVFLVMPEASNSVEAVTLVHDVTLTVRSVRGDGLLILHEKDADKVSAIVLSAQPWTGLESEQIELRVGDSYAYRNIGDEPFVIRDDCMPAFFPEYEVPADSASPIHRAITRIAAQPILS